LRLVKEGEEVNLTERQIACTHEWEKVVLPDESADGHILSDIFWVCRLCDAESESDPVEAEKEKK
jgi:hypothetical protein